MIHLTELVFLFKKYRKLVVLSTVAFVVFIFIVINWNAIVKAIIPVKPPPDTVAFGILPKYDLTDAIKPSNSLDFRLQTITGNFPKFTKSAKVFAVARKIPSFASEEAFKNKAVGLGFNPDPIRIDGSLMEFASSERVQKSLKGDTLTQNFIMSFKIEPQLITRKPRNIEEAQDAAISFFRVMGLDTVQFPKEKTVIKRLKFENNQIVEADSLSSADMIEVDFHFADFDKLPVVFTRKGSGPVVALVANEQVVYAKKEAPNIELFRYATYPLKPVSNAWDELKAGGGYFNVENANSTIDIKDIKLGYVIGVKNNLYIQPVYLFYGEGDFMAFVPAVSEAWTEKAR